MREQEHLPTLVSAAWSTSAFRDSLLAALREDGLGSDLRLYFYAVTSAGWEQIRAATLNWKRSLDGRSVTLFVGTDHAITDPAAIRRMWDDGLDVRLMTRYQGVFHPKVMWLAGKRKHLVWVGSNNLTRDGLLNNIEFGVLLRTSRVPAAMRQWTNAVEAGSERVTEALIVSYENQRAEFERVRAAAAAVTFTWSRKHEPTGVGLLKAKRGSLIVEVMPRETGEAGKQLQLPIVAASGFFGLRGAGSTKAIQLRSSDEPRPRTLTMTVFGNNTVRLSLSSLEYRDRPCVVVFEKRAGYFVYEIVPQAIFPTRYKWLLSQCVRQTRAGSRRWGLVTRAR